MSAEVQAPDGHAREQEEQSKNTPEAEQAQASFPFFDERFPAELRQEVYTYLAWHVNHVLWQQYDHTPGSYGYGKRTTSSRKSSKELFLRYALVCSAMHTGLHSREAATLKWNFRANYCLFGPSSTRRNDGRHNTIALNTIDWRLLGSLRDELDVGERSDYSVRIIFDRTASDGYRLKWEHLTTEDLKWARLTQEDYDAMIVREVEAFASTVAERETMDGKKCLCPSGLSRVIKAFYFNKSKT